MFECSEGESIFLGGEIPHLYIVITPKCGEDEEVVVVNMTSKQPTSDTTVILSAADHPSINHDSVISYFHAEIRRSEELIGLAETGYYDIPKQKFTQDLVEKIRNGAMDSPHTPIRIQKFLTNHKLIK